jgi:hypothetical protein
MKQILRFSLVLAVSLAIVLGIHLLLLNLYGQPLFDHMIIPAYVINFLLAVGIYTLLFYLQHKYPSQLGFIFMAGSFLKFIVFFIVFFPNYKADGKMEILEFAAFFAPYAICLIFETLGVIKILKK